jgi:hypothetical protein
MATLTCGWQRGVNCKDRFKEGVPKLPTDWVYCHTPHSVFPDRILLTSTNQHGSSTSQPAPAFQHWPALKAAFRWLDLPRYGERVSGWLWLRKPTPPPLAYRFWRLIYDPRYLYEFGVTCPILPGLYACISLAGLLLQAGIHVCVLLGDTGTCAAADA